MQTSTSFGMPLPEGSNPQPARSDPFRILVLGDLGSDRPWSDPVRIDRDNFGRVFQQFQVRVRLGDQADFPGTDISFAALDDFHPDQLFEQLKLFASLRERRARLADDTTFRDEAGAILAAGGKGPVPADSAEEKTSGPVAESGVDSGPADLLLQSLELTETSRQPVIDQIIEGHLGIDELVRRTVAPYVADRADPRQAEFIAGVDVAIAAAMRGVLHDPEFQRLESVWRGIRMLVRRLETGPELQIHVVHVPRQQLVADLTGDDDLTRSRLYRMLRAASENGDTAWSVVVGDYGFDASQADVDVLGRLAQIHASQGAVFVAGACPRIVGCESFAATPDPDDWTMPDAESSARWQALRALPSASSVVLALPRFLGRLPYGAQTDPTDAFEFEEIPDGREHEHCLWINSAFAVAIQLGRSFSEQGWSLASDWIRELDGLPVWLHSRDGETEMKPAGEIELVLRAGNRLAEGGMTPVHSVRDEGTVLIPALRSLSLQQEDVAGRWE